MATDITTKDGLLYRDGEPILLPAADLVAAGHGYSCAEQMVRALESKDASDERGGLPSASGIEQIALCPGSWEAQRGLPRIDDTTDADIGTRIHDRIAQAVEAGTYPKDLSDDETRTMERCLLETDRIVAETFNLDGDAQNAHAFPGARLVEHRLWIEFDGQRVASGKPDLVFIHDRKALVIDFKTGWVGATAAEANLQLRALAVAVNQLHDVTSTTVAIVSPNAGEKVTVAEYTREDVMEAEDELVTILSRIPGGRRIPSAKACRWCKAKAVCPEAIKVAGDTMQALEVTDLNTRAKNQTSALKFRLMALEPEKVAEFLDRISVIEYVIDAIKSSAKARLEAETGSIPGWRLSPGSTRRSIRDATAAFEKLAGVLSANQFAGCCTVKISELESEYRKATGMPAALAKSEFEEKLGDLIERKTSAPSLEKV